MPNWNWNWNWNWNLNRNRNGNRNRNRDRRRSRKETTRLARSHQNARNKGGGGHSGRTQCAAINRAGGEKKRFAGPKRGISTLSGAVSRYGGVRSLALGLSFGGRSVRRRCCKMRVVAIKRGESRAWGRFFSGLRRKDPDADPPAAQAARRISPSHRRSGGIAFGRIAAGVCLHLPPPPLNRGCRPKQ